MRVAYGKIGRTLELSPKSWGQVAGSNEPPVLLNKLARRNPQHTFVIVTRNPGEDPQALGLPTNVVNPFIELNPILKAEVKRIGQEDRVALSDMYEKVVGPLYHDADAIILWAGQHGTSNTPIPKVENPAELTKPQISFVHYTGFALRGINTWREPDPQGRKEVWLVPDVRNYLKGRDLKNPPGHILGQYDFVKHEKHHRYGDPRQPAELGFGPEVTTGFCDPGVWGANHRYEYAQLEITGIPSSLECSYDWDGRDKFGIIINEARGYVKLNRLDAMREWVKPLPPSWVAGTWSADSQTMLGLGPISPIPWHAQWDRLRTVRSTFTTPSSGSGWATTKPWESFGCGVVCFFHVSYDDQGHVIPTTAQLDAGAWADDADLHAAARWLRTDTPEQLAKRVEVVNQDRDVWHWLVTQQRRLFDAAMAEGRCMNEIEKRCGL